ncbi:MAG TPA: glycosyltransferase family 4 protein [Candidatus Acidoferrales bacterium]|nr:glycosyltransferase family 4 protein [Candidatus Acidoferrales bacterium]
MREFTPSTKRIIGLFPDLLGVGGIQAAGRLTAAALDEIARRHDWQTDFLSLNDSPGKHLLRADQRDLELHGFGRAKTRFVLSGMADARAGKGPAAGAVLAMHPNLALPARWIQRTARSVKTIVICHGVEVWKPLPRLRRRALVAANLVLAPSSDTIRKLISVQGVPQESIRKLPWCLSPSFLAMADDSGKLPELPDFPRGRVVLAVGRWAASERYKGVDLLIGAIAQLRGTHPDLRLVAVGSGDDLPRLRALAGNLGVSGVIHFLENLSREEIAACYAQADLFALPSTAEGFGLVFLEAMAFSKAVVGAAAGGSVDVIEDGVNGLLVPANDPERLAQALDRLLRDEALCTELGRRGAEIVRQKFQFSTFRDELERILTDCVLAGENLAS